MVGTFGDPYNGLELPEVAKEPAQSATVPCNIVFISSMGLVYTLKGLKSPFVGLIYPVIG